MFPPDFSATKVVQEDGTVTGASFHLSDSYLPQVLSIHHGVGCTLCDESSSIKANFELVTRDWYLLLELVL